MSSRRHFILFSVATFSTRYEQHINVPGWAIFFLSLLPYDIAAAIAAAIAAIAGASGGGEAIAVAGAETESSSSSEKRKAASAQLVEDLQ